jgi:hypothetical protein
VPSGLGAVLQPLQGRAASQSIKGFGGEHNVPLQRAVASPCCLVQCPLATPAAAAALVCLCLASLLTTVTTRTTELLQSLNPLPLVAMWANCVAWLVYSFLTVDIYVLASNIPGLLLGSFMTISCYGYADEKASTARYYALLQCWFEHADGLSCRLAGCARFCTLSFFWQCSTITLAEPGCRVSMSGC